MFSSTIPPPSRIVAGLYPSFSSSSSLPHRHLLPLDMFPQTPISSSLPLPDPVSSVTVLRDDSGETPSDSPVHRRPVLNQATETSDFSPARPIATSPAVVVTLPSSLSTDLDGSVPQPITMSVDGSVLEQEQGTETQLEKRKVDSVNSGKEVVGKVRSPTQPPPLQGAWTKKLNFASTSTVYDQHQQPTVQPALKPLAAEDDIRFPWAAKMNPASRNLFRAAEPEYLEDGTPKVTIPPHVLLQGLENQKEYVLGQFHRCTTPPGGLIFAVFNKIWGRNCKITIRKLGVSTYLFHIPEESTRTWVLQRGLWHVDDCLMFVAPWTPKASLAIPEIKTIPVWLTLKNIPSILYSISGISHIASGLGAPMATHKPKLDPVFMGEAKILVEVELSKAFPPRIAADDKNGFIWMVDVEYAWVPSKCGRCGQLGHKVKRCLLPASESQTVVGDLGIDSNAKVSNEEIVSSDVIVSDVMGLTISNNLVSVITQTTESSPAVQVATIQESLPIDTSSLDGIASDESTKGGPNFLDNADDLISLASLSVLENMSVFAPTVVTINEKIESPSESTQNASVLDGSKSQAISAANTVSTRVAEPDFGSNKFALLISPEEEGVLSDSDRETETDSMDLMTPSGKRILRERPVKPSTKVKEMYWQSGARGRGRGKRGGRG